MALFLARLVMVSTGIAYSVLGAYMVVSGGFKEITRRTYLPMTLFIGSPPPAMFEDPDFDAYYDRNFIPYIIAGVMLAAVGISFLANIP